MPTYGCFVNGATCGTTWSVLCRPGYSQPVLAMARKTNQRKPRKRVAQVKVRLPEPLRIRLEIAAHRAGHSMNAEIVKRLGASLLEVQTTKLIANALLTGLDDAVIEALVDKVLRDRGYDEAAEQAREEEQARLAERAGDAYTESLVDLRREGGEDTE